MHTLDIRSVMKKDNTTQTWIKLWPLPKISVDIPNIFKSIYFNIYIRKYWSCHEEGEDNAKLAEVMVPS